MVRISSERKHLQLLDLHGCLTKGLSCHALAHQLLVTMKQNLRLAMVTRLAYCLDQELRKVSTEGVQQMVFVPNDTSAQVLKPREEAFDLRTSLVATQRTAVLGRDPGPMVGMGRNHLDAAFVGQTRVEGIAIIGLVTNQTLRTPIWETDIKSRIAQSHFMWASAGCANGRKKTASVCKAHDSGAFAPFGFAHTIAPFFAEAEMPSMKPSLKSMPPRSRRSSAKAVRILAKTPDSVHSRKRRW